MESAHFLLGVEIRRKLDGGYFMVQEKYAAEVVSRYGMAAVETISTPFEPGSNFGAKEVPVVEGVDPEMVDIPYRSLIGSLVYLAVCTRPDLSMDVSALSRYIQNPQMVHWEAVKRVLRYVKGIAGEGLGYSPGEEIAVWGYSDASYGSNVETKKGRYGFVFMSGGAAIRWGNKLQEVATLSSTEAENMAICHAMHEGLYLRILQQEMGFNPGGSGTFLLVDKLSSIKLAKNPMFHKRSKRIAIQFHFLHEKVESGEFGLEFVKTLSMADLVPGQPPIPVAAPIDSGASDSFLDPSILVRYHLHPLPHPVPISLELTFTSCWHYLSSSFQPPSPTPP